MLHQSVADIIRNTPVFWHTVKGGEIVQDTLARLYPRDGEARETASGDEKNDEKNKEPAIFLVCDDDGIVRALVRAEDILRAICARAPIPKETAFEDVIQDGPCDTLRPSDSLLDALEIMTLRAASHLPLVDEAGRPLGVLSQRRLLVAVKTYVDMQIRDTQGRLFGEHVLKTASEEK